LYPIDYYTAYTGGNITIQIRAVIYKVVLIALVGLGIGTITSVTVVGFVELVSWLNDKLLISAKSRVQHELSAYLLPAMTILVPSIGGLLTGWMLQSFVEHKRALGPPDVILQAQIHSPAASFKSGIASSLAAVVSLGCGASVGQYGPMVYLGCMLGNMFARFKILLPNIGPICIGCGVAAAIATAFNAPIAGLVFTHEVILRHYSIQAFAPITVASVTGYVIAKLFFAREALFLVNFDGVGHSYEFLFFAIEGALCAFLAVLFMRSILASAKLASRSGIHKMLQPMLAGLILGMLALVFPDVLGIGRETLRFATIEGAFEMSELVLLFSIKMLVTALCIGFGFAGGVFSPALLIGILFGAWYGSAVAYLLPEYFSSIEVYAVCGMMALTSAVIGAPLTTIIIVFELTRNYDLTVAAMVSVVFSNLLAWHLFGRSLFDRQLLARGFDFVAGRDHTILDNTPIVNFARQSYQVCYMDEPVKVLVERLATHSNAQAMVVNRNNTLLGIIRRRDINHSATDIPIAALMQNVDLCFDQTTSISQAMLQLHRYKGDVVPVIDVKKSLLGVVSESEAIQAYTQTLQNLREEENAVL